MVDNKRIHEYDIDDSRFDLIGVRAQLASAKRSGNPNV
jgi:hypothetical protein